MVLLWPLHVDVLYYVYAAVFFIALAAYAHKKRVNMSALGIGVDFLQIMSIFTSFGFTWPANLKALFQYTSLSTFNDQMMAPECTVTTWTFTNKCVCFTVVAYPFFITC